MKNLVMLNMSHKFDWDNGVANRNYHVLHTLAEGGEFERILAVDFLPFTLKKRAKVWLKGKLYSKNANTVFYNGAARVDTDPEKENLFWMIALSLDSLDSILSQLGMNKEETVLWSYNPFTSTTIEEWNGGISVFDAVDNWIEHPAYGKYTEELEQHYARIRRNADIIFTVSEGLIDFFDKRDDSFYIPNGVDAAHFAPDTKRAVPDELARRDTNRPLIGYHGVLQSRINFSILKHITQSRPEWDILMVGPIWDDAKKDMQELLRNKNVYHVGATSYFDLPQYIAQFDVAIIPHKVDRFTQSMNPLKMYEYLAAGKAIVSTAVSGAEQFQDYISLAVSPSDFDEAISNALNNDTVEWQEKRVAAASAHSWVGRVEIMLKRLHEVEKVKQEEPTSAE